MLPHYAVILVNQIQGDRSASQMNKLLCELQTAILERQQPILTAFVYETPELRVTPFRPLNEVYFKERCTAVSGSRNFHRLFAMSRLLLADHATEASSLHLILVSDHPLSSKELSRMAMIHTIQEPPVKYYQTWVIEAASSDGVSQPPLGCPAVTDAAHWFRYDPEKDSWSPQLPASA